MTSLSVLYARMLSRIAWVGDVDGCISYTENIPPEHIKKNTGKEYQAKLIQKFEDRRDQITCYALRRKLGLKNSSNDVENTNEITTANKQKDDRSFWRDNGSGGNAAINCIFANGEDEEYFMHDTFSFEKKYKYT